MSFVINTPRFVERIRVLFCCAKSMSYEILGLGVAEKNRRRGKCDLYLLYQIFYVVCKEDCHICPCSEVDMLFLSVE